MSGRAIVARLRRLALEDAGYALAFPALVLVETVLSQAIIRKISFTEIDFQTYLGQSALFLAGERDYSKLDPEGGSGPCVYPAGHVYLFSLLHKLTDGGANVLPAQYAFQALLTATTLVVAALYRQAGVPPILTVPLVLSKRIHSIFLLRLFNDPVALFFVYLGLLLAVKGLWKTSSIVLSLGLGIKMNVLLLLPGLLVAAFIQTGLVGAIAYLSGIVLVQVLISLPFTLHNTDAYLANAFDFGRAFLYEWTVNWRFVPEPTFKSKLFAHYLLAAHIGVLVLFGLFKWTQLGTIGPRWFLQYAKKGMHRTDKAATVGVLSMAFTSNLIGVLYSRSLHYQFYSWYFHQVPFLLWFSRLPVLLKLVVPICLEWCWNVFPSTPESSFALLLCHVVLVTGSCTIPSLTSALSKTPLPAEDEVEVELLLSNEDTPATRPDDAHRAEQVAARHNEALAKAREREQNEVATFHRRMAVRRRLASVLGRGILLVRTLLVVAAVGLFFVVLHPNSPVSKGTYVDENALQPGQSRVYWDYFDVTHADMLSEKVARLGAAGTSEERAEFVRSELASYGLDARLQAYKYRRGGAQLAGVNAYARSATPRIDGREAVILTASWQSQWYGDDVSHAANETETGRKTNVRGIASLLALARYLSTQAHLSKDLIFVVSDGYLEGVNAWSSAYFGSQTADVDADPIRIGGSHVWNAISLDYPADSFSSLVVQYEGMDGQLPNMDVVNTLVRVAERVADGVSTILAPRQDKTVLLDAARRVSERLQVPMRSDVERELRNYEQGARAAARQFGYGAAGRPSGPHALFQRYHVDAITIFAVPGEGPYGFYHMGRIVESFVRSMSNLLERLHHSQFFYLLLTPYRFVPIGVVILIPLFLSISMTITGMQIWFQEEAVSKQIRAALFAGSSALVAATEVQDAEPESPTLAWYRDRLAERWARKLDDGAPTDIAWTAFAALGDALTSSTRPYQGALIGIVTSLVAASLALFGLSSMSYDGLKTLSTSYHASLAVSMCMLFSTWLAVLLRWQDGAAAQARLGRVMISFAGIQAGMGVAVLSVLNFALASVLGLFLLLALAIANVRAPGLGSRRETIALRAALVQILNPVIWLALGPVLPIALSSTLSQLAEQLLLQWSILGSNTVPILALFYLPILLQLQTSLVLLLTSPRPTTYAQVASS